MNANELADALDDIAQNSTRIHVHIKEHLTKAATMLRQLEAENGKLKAKSKGWNDGVLEQMKEDGEFYNQRHCEQQAEIEELKHDIGEYVRINAELATENMALRKEIEALKLKTATGYETR